jgi:hypothetical protein
MDVCNVEKMTHSMNFLLVVKPNVCSVLYVDGGDCDCDGGDGVFLLPMPVVVQLGHHQMVRHAMPMNWIQCRVF